MSVTDTAGTAAPESLEALRPIVETVVAPSATEVDVSGAYPRVALDALGQAGLLGLVTGTDAGGLGQGHRAAALVIEELARHCASTAMVVLMHYAAAAVLEAHGPEDVRRRVAAGRYVTTLPSRSSAPAACSGCRSAAPHGRRAHRVRADRRTPPGPSGGRATWWCSKRPRAG